MKPMVSIIILNWNGKRYLDKCIESVINQKYENVEIVLVDNGSTDDSLDYVLEKYAISSLIRNSTNQGFAKGMNVGIEAAKGKYIMMLNMDVYLAPSTVEDMVKAFNAYPAVGVIMGKEYSWSEKGLINIPSISAGPGFLKKRCQGFSDKKKIDQLVYSFGAMGSFPIFRKKTLDDIYSIAGYYFDPKFETGWEDKDIFFRTHHSGWKFLYNPTCIGYHAISGSVGGKKLLIEKDIVYQTRIIRNRYFFIFKNYPLKLLIKHLPILVVVELILYPYYLFKNPLSLLALIKGQFAFIKQLKFIMNDRKNILNNSLLDLHEILTYFKRI
ncbi:MAG: glycosyltransferase family 2 protein [Pseudomonadota bacterium]